MRDPWRRLMRPNFLLALGVVLLFSLAVLHPAGKAAAFVAGLEKTGLLWLLFLPLGWAMALPLAARMRDTQRGHGPPLCLVTEAVTGTHRTVGWRPWIFWLLTGLWV